MKAQEQHNTDVSAEGPQSPVLPIVLVESIYRNAQEAMQKWLEANAPKEVITLYTASIGLECCLAEMRSGNMSNANVEVCQDISDVIHSIEAVGGRLRLNEWA